MPFELTTAEQEERAAYVAALLAARIKVEAAIEAYNDVQQTVREELELQFGRFLETLDAAQAWTAGVVCQANSEFSGKPDAWQSSAAASEALAWIREWDMSMKNPPGIDMPDPVEMDWADYVNDLHTLRSGASDRRIALPIGVSRPDPRVICYKVPGRFVNGLLPGQPTKITIEQSGGVIYYLDNDFRRITALATINDRMLSGWDDGLRFVADAGVLASVGIRYIGAADDIERGRSADNINT